jgi:hypothetical protein
LKVTGALLLAIFLYGGSFAIGSAATWTNTNPCGMPSTSALCKVGSPINTSRSLQTKYGSLTLSNGLTVSNPYTHYCDVDHAVSCSIDADCTNAGAGSYCVVPPMLLVDNSLHNATFTWTSIDYSTITTLTEWGGAFSSNLYVDLWSSENPQQPLREGFVAVKASDTVTPNHTATIDVTAADTAGGGTVSYAVKAFDNYSTNTSYALLAKAGFNDPKSRALRAIAPWPGKFSWAGYFDGNVSIESPFSLVMGGTGEIGPDVDSSICLGGYDEEIAGVPTSHPRVCLSAWPTVTIGDDQWIDTGTYIQVKNASFNLALGGHDAADPHPAPDDPHTVFYLTAKPNSEADILVRGTGRSDTLTIE